MSGNKGFRNYSKSGSSYISKKQQSNKARSEAGKYFNKGIKGLLGRKENKKS